MNQEELKKYPVGSRIRFRLSDTSRYDGWHVGKIGSAGGEQTCEPDDKAYGSGWNNSVTAIELLSPAPVCGKVYRGEEEILIALNNVIPIGTLIRWRFDDGQWTVGECRRWRPSYAVDPQNILAVPSDFVDNAHAKNGLAYADELEIITDLPQTACAASVEGHSQEICTVNFITESAFYQYSSSGGNGPSSVAQLELIPARTRLASSRSDKSLMDDAITAARKLTWDEAKHGVFSVENVKIAVGTSPAEIK